MIQNPAWTTGYNIIALPPAVADLYHAGIMPSPTMEEVLMSVSIGVLAANARTARIR